ncbi:MAG: NADH:ubiquinone reductase (Na(+)-transporting) subunit A [Gemmatimonadetes bacterium]|nr:NADH:ubiquinone reductase (Na(+)-transporting) subunit A [Gemmatimonadota bacterium]
MSEIRMKRGWNVPLSGAPAETVVDAARPVTVSVRPNEFRLVKPRLLVKEGDRVSAGQPLFQDRERAEVQFPSPGGGEVAEVRFGPRRVCEEIVIRLDAQETWAEHRPHSPADARALNRAQVVEMMLDSGLWTSLRRRPFSTIPDPTATPAGIFVAGSDNSPLAASPALAMQGRDEDFQLGVDLLAKLTEGRVHVCLLKGKSVPALVNAQNCEKHTFSGPYPAGLIEAQIHYVLPHKKGREVWYLDCQDVADLGEFARTGRYPVNRVVAVGGEGATSPQHYRTRRGVSCAHLDPKASPAANRFVSGSVLSGTQVRCDSGLGHYDAKFSVIPEGDDADFVGWMLPGEDRVSRFRTFASTLTRPQAPRMTANLNGSVRAHIATGIYEDVCAVDILPAYLMRALHVGDIEEAESLGLEDCAECGLCTFVCPSKIDFQGIIVRGIESVLKEDE